LRTSTWGRTKLSEKKAERNSFKMTISRTESRGGGGSVKKTNKESVAGGGSDPLWTRTRYFHQRRGVG